MPGVQTATRFCEASETSRLSPLPPPGTMAVAGPTACATDKRVPCLPCRCLRAARGVQPLLPRYAHTRAVRPRPGRADLVPRRSREMLTERRSGRVGDGRGQW